ncbi:MAG: hypothetical protein V3V99_13315 [candidate division Zixibacteria bacterium]
MKFFSIVLIFIIGTCSSLSEAQKIFVKKISMDRNLWGLRYLKIPIENNRNDTARVSAEYFIKYENHYLSGLERTGFDTTFIVPPKSTNEYRFYYELPGSFGRSKSRLLIRWKYDNPLESDTIQDSTLQSFNTTVTAIGGADQYDAKKHSPGPAYGILNYQDIFFEYPRLLLYLLARQKTVDEIGTIFRVDLRSSYSIIDRLRSEGLFPEDQEDLKPRLVAISENEGFQIRPQINIATESFQAWYKSKGKAKLDEILAETGINPEQKGSKALRTLVLLSLLNESWTEPGSLSGLESTDFGKVLSNLNSVKWIVQGGDFFMPRLSLGAYEKNKDIVLFTFSLDPVRGYEKARLTGVHENIEEKIRLLQTEVPSISPKDLIEIMKIARQSGLTDDLLKDIKSLLESVTSNLETYQGYQEPYLANYLIRSVVGGAFAERRHRNNLDFIIVRY